MNASENNCRKAFNQDHETKEPSFSSKASSVNIKSDEEILHDVTPWLLSHKDCDIIAEGDPDVVKAIKKLHDRVFTGKFYTDGKVFSCASAGGKVLEETSDTSKNNPDFQPVKNNSAVVNPDCKIKGETKDLCDGNNINGVEFAGSMTGAIKCKAVKKGSAFEVLGKEEELSRLICGKAFADKIDEINFGKIKSMNKECKNKTVFADIMGLAVLLLCISAMFLWWFAFPVTMKASLEMFWLELFLPDKQDQRTMCKWLLIINFAIILAVAIILKKKSYNYDNYNTVLVFTVFGILCVSFFASYYVDYILRGAILDVRFIGAILRILINLKGFLFVSLPVLLLIEAYRLTVNPFYENFRAKDAEAIEFSESEDYEKYLKLKNETASYTVE